MLNRTTNRTIASSNPSTSAPCRAVVLILASFLLAACAGNPGGSSAQRCSNGLDLAYKELDLAKAHGFGGTVDWGKAAGLLAAAKVQYEFEHYPNCIEKVTRAQVYIKRSKGG